jgi:hypothetical protein
MRYFTPRSIVTFSVLTLFMMFLAVACVGDQGPAGPQGSQGIQGESGVDGMQGSQGERGAQGSQGIQGDQGSQGKQGPQGSQGSQGKQGTHGSQGSQGKQGTHGSQGPQGEQGFTPDFSSFLGLSPNARSNLRDAVVYIQDAGSGIRISRNEIITVVSSLDSNFIQGSTGTVTVAIRGEGVVLAKLQGYDTVSKVALLTFTPRYSEGTFAEITSSFAIKRTTSGSFIRGVALVGMPVALVGYATDMSTTSSVVTYGNIGGRWKSIGSGVSWGQIDAQYLTGMLGGAIFNQYEELVGMITGSHSNLPGHTLFTTSLYINGIIQDLRAGKKE